MTNLSPQDSASMIEAFPMKSRDCKTLNPLRPETKSANKPEKESNNIPSTSQKGQGCKVSWGEAKTQNCGTLASGLLTESVCETCANGSHNRAVYQAGRLSLPLNGKYANYHSRTNGVHSKTKIPCRQIGVNGVKSPLQRSHSGNIYCCGSSRNRVFQGRVPEKPWKSKGDYYVAVLTYLLGVGNVIRFPQLCFKHGGGAFFIPYFIMLIIEGIPLLCLEMAVGQRLGRNSVVESWKDLSPSLRGIGIAAALMSLVTIFYYNYIVAWCLYYFVHSIRSTLLWSTCPTIDHNGTETAVTECANSSPAEYYWYRDTLDVADDIDNSTGINMYLYLFVVASWTVSFLMTMRGSRGVSKVLLVILSFIIISLVTFFFLGVHLDGWAEGLALLFIPEWEKLKDPVVWMDAAGQIFYSLGVGFGTLTLFSTGHKPKNNFYMDAIMSALGNCGTSLWASIIMFSLFGFKASYEVKKCETTRNASVGNNGSEAASCSKEKIFQQLPPGLSLGFAGLSGTFPEMPLSPALWSSFFYFLLFLLGSSSMLGMIEIVLITFKEIKLFTSTWRNELICGLLCLAMCISNLLFVQSTGFYLLEIISSASSIPLLLTGLVECVGVTYIYGVDRFSKDLLLMTGQRVRRRWHICWKFISPLIILSVIIGGLVQMIRDMADGKYTYTAWDRNQAEIRYLQYPAWGYVIYTLFVLIPLVCIIYPPVKDYVMRRRSESENGGDSRAIICEQGCCIGRSRSYDLEQSSSCVNGHVNQSIQLD